VALIGGGNCLQDFGMNSGVVIAGKAACGFHVPNNLAEGGQRRAGIGPQASDLGRQASGARHRALDVQRGPSAFEARRFDSVLEDSPVLDACRDKLEVCGPRSDARFMALQWCY
jgi:hypothetical protein